MAVTAYPTILVDSTDGAASDTACSGAGPATALTGTSASYSGSVFTLDGSPDLSGVNTTGDHVIYVQTSTGRRFFAINAKDDGADTVTVEQAPAGTTTGLTWAIGGVRATAVENAESYLLWEQAANANGDILARWAVEMQSGHTETISANKELRPATSLALGAAILRGASGAATRPVFTSTVDDWALENVATRPMHFLDFDLIAGGTGGSANGIKVEDHSTAQGLKVTEGTGSNDFAVGIWVGDWAKVLNCEVSGCSGDGIGSGNGGNWQIKGCYIHDNGGDGIGAFANIDEQVVVVGNTIVDNTLYGMYLQFSNASAYIANNDIHSNDQAGIYINGTAIKSITIIDNHITNNTGYGVDAPNLADEEVDAFLLVTFNNFDSNSSGATNPSLANENGLSGDADNGNYNTGTDFSKGSSYVGKAAAHPGGAMLGTTTTSFKDVGAVQREEPAGGGGGGTGNPFRGPI